MPIRNPFARRPGPAAVQDENQRPGSAAGTPDAAHPGFERVDTVGSKASSAFSVRSRRSQDTGEYKLSVVNDSGVYLPPSPIEKEAPWPRRYLSRTSTTSDRSSVVSGSGLGTGGGGGGSGEIEHFSISRESFDSYRRSFDISAKSPVFMATDALAPGRQSLDSHLFSPPTTRFPRSSLGDHPRSPPMMQRRWDRQREQSLRSEEGSKEQVDEEEGIFEEVGLHTDGAADTRQSQSQPPPPPRRRGFFAKFASDSSAGTPEASASPPPAAAATPAEETGMISRFLPLSGRKRAPSSSVQGAELRAMPVAGLDGPERVETPVAGLQAGEA